MQEKVPHRMVANISDGKLLCISKLIPNDENVILSDYLQLLYLLQQLYIESLGIIRLSSLIIDQFG